MPKKRKKEEAFMKGLELSREYFNEYGLNMLEEKFPQYMKYIAAGLVGEGSECFGFDDEISRDHDFGPGFCIWIPEEIKKEAGGELQRAYMSLPRSFRGFTRMETPQAAGRVGVIAIEEFYRRFTGLAGEPENNMQWFVIPEHYLATAVNGEVFMDSPGRFTQVRNRLKAFYPEDVLRKKLAARAALMAQSGQYNYVRCAKRGDECGAYLSCAEFVRNALSCIYLLNGRYMPFYKWAFRGTEELPDLKETAAKLKRLAATADKGENIKKKEELIEEICLDVESFFRKRGLTATRETFIMAHGQELMDSIEDEKLRKMHIMAV